MHLEIIAVVGLVMLGLWGLVELLSWLAERFLGVKR